jgi:FAD/FMN-containing dehydrogenase/Fe-S oxidoreductase
MMQLAVVNSRGERRTARPQAAQVDVNALEVDLQRHVEGEVRFDDGSRGLYATDASNYRQVPIGVVIPRSIDDVVATIAVCRRHHAPIVSRGGGTSLAGQCCNVAVVIDFSQYINQVLEIDVAQKRARVQPGVINDHLRKPLEQQYHLTFGPDPATHGWCTFGGMLGNNSCGVHATMAGCVADNVYEMEVLTYDGVRLRVGPTSEEELATIIRAGGRRGEIYQGLKAIRDQYADLIRQRYPRIPRRISGYNLNELLPESGCNVARALVGTEGTCVTILEATVRLIDSPPERALLVLGYADVYAAGDHVTEIMEHQPLALEGLDDKLVSFMQKKHMHPQSIQKLPEGKGWLVVEVGGETREEVRDKAQQIMQALRKNGHPPSIKLFDNPTEQAHIWEVRESGLGATAHIPGMPEAWSGWEDAAVHPKDLGNYLRDFRKLMDKFGYDAALYGHFGQACIHCRITFELRTHDGIQKYRAFIDQAADLVVRYNGSLSGEHGDGQARGRLLPKMYGPELVEAFRQFKTLWDPQWQMNPGKVIDANPPEANLRLGPAYRPWEPETYFQFPEESGSFAKATLRCVGVGKCRRTDNAFMCPSYQVTQEEKHTTRGRAHLLFEMVKGDVITDGWRSEEVREALDLCLACKGCKTDCPVNVDLATYKAEFLSHYYAGRLRPRSAYAMGLIGWWARLAAQMPALVNFFSQTAPFAAVLKSIGGIAQARRLPPFAGQTFTAWYRQRRTQRSEGPPVVLYPDVFNDYFYPETLKSALQVLERLGYRVIVPHGRVPALRPLIDFGMLALTKRQIPALLQHLRPYLTEGIPVVGLEPSTVAVLRDEMPNLLPHDMDVQRLRQKAHLLSEFLDQEDVELPQLHRQAVLHNHCHQKAVLNAQAMANVLNKIGVHFEEPEPGCCGMAGAFGFEAEHYAISMQIGEQHLLPSVRQAAKDTLILADGFSCRTQIAQGSDRHPLHLSELLLMAFDTDPRTSVRSYPELSYVLTHPPVLAGSTVTLVGAALVGGMLVARMLNRRV